MTERKTITDAESLLQHMSRQLVENNRKTVVSNIIEDYRINLTKVINTVKPMVYRGVIYYRVNDSKLVRHEDIAECISDIYKIYALKKCVNDSIPCDTTKVDGKQYLYYTVNDDDSDDDVIDTDEIHDILNKLTKQGPPTEQGPPAVKRPRHN
jgi:hypothetical protein